MHTKYTFKDFLSNSWWLIFIVIIHAINNSAKDSPTGSTFFDTVILTGVLLVILYIYWFIKYGKHKNY